MRICTSLLALVFVLAATDAAAQSFPAEGQWYPLACDEQRMTDRFQDEAGAIDERDLVGDLDAPAGMHAADASFLYLRMRLDRDASPGGALAAFAWGFAIDLDRNARTYELLLLVDGTGNQDNVIVYRNTMTTTPNDPADPADTPAVMTFPANTHARSNPASGSNFGGGSDHWLEMAVPWSTLTPLGLSPTTPIGLWAASSTMADRLDGDFACHDGATGEPGLDVIISDPTTLDPIVDTDGDGFTDAEEVGAGSDPNDPDSVPRSRLEGGGGCNTGGGGALPLALVLLALVRRRR